MSTAVTRGIRVTAEARFSAEHSEPGRHVFVYTITIANEGTAAARLVSRHWIITDAHGEEQHVRGAGVVGQQPLIQPGEQHRYTSFCPLETPIGAMRGSYRMVRPDGEEFDAEVAPFALALPGALN